MKDRKTPQSASSASHCNALQTLAAHWRNELAAFVMLRATWKTFGIAITVANLDLVSISLPVSNRETEPIYSMALPSVNAQSRSLFLITDTESDPMSISTSRRRPWLEDDSMSNFRQQWSRFCFRHV